MVMLDTVVRDYFVRSSLCFITQVLPTVVHDGKVIMISHYDKAKFPADFDGPIVGAGQAHLDFDSELSELFNLTVTTLMCCMMGKYSNRQLFHFSAHMRCPS